MHSTARKRSIALAAGFAATALVLAGCSSAADESGDSDSKSIVVSTFPFGVEEFQEAIFDPFTEATGSRSSSSPARTPTASRSCSSPTATPAST